MNAAGLSKNIMEVGRLILLQDIIVPVPMFHCFPTEIGAGNHRIRRDKEMRCP